MNNTEEDIKQKIIMPFLKAPDFKMMNFSLKKVFLFASRGSLHELIQKNK